MYLKDFFKNIDFDFCPTDPNNWPIVQWYTIEMSQTLNKAGEVRFVFKTFNLKIFFQFVFKFTVDTEKIWEKKNNQAQLFSNVKFYTSDPWYPAPDAQMRALTVITKYD